MKIFCMSCGKKNEYIGLANKPSCCCSCQTNFSQTGFETDGVFTPYVYSKFVTTKPSYIIEGVKYNRNFLLGLITMERVEDT